MNDETGVLRRNDDGSWGAGEQYGLRVAALGLALALARTVELHIVAMEGVALAVARVAAFKDAAASQ